MTLQLDMVNIAIYSNAIVAIALVPYTQDQAYQTNIYSQLARENLRDTARQATKWVYMQQK